MLPRARSGATYAEPSHAVERAPHVRGRQLWEGRPLHNLRPAPDGRRAPGPLRPHDAVGEAEGGLSLPRRHAAVAAERGNPFQHPTPSSGSPAAPELSSLFVSSMSRHNPFATPRSVCRAPSATTTFQRLLYARDNARNEDKDDEALDASRKFNPF